MDATSRLSELLQLLSFRAAYNLTGLANSIVQSLRVEGYDVPVELVRESIERVVYAAEVAEMRRGTERLSDSDRADWAYGNAVIDNPEVTRDMAEHAVESTPPLYGEDARRVREYLSQVAPPEELQERRENARKFAAIVGRSVVSEPNAAVTVTELKLSGGAREALGLPRSKP